MSHRGLRVFAFLVAAASVAAGGYHFRELERRGVAERSAERVFEGQAHEAALLVERVRTAQQSYVAEGQGVAYWMSKQDETRAALERTLAVLASSATADPAREAASRASSLASQQKHLDQRARTYIENGQRLMASDLIFTESSGALGEISRQVDQARTEERTASDARVDAIRAEQDYVLAGVAAVCLLCALVLVSRGGSPRPQDERAALRSVMQDGTPAGGTLVRPDGTPSSDMRLVAVPSGEAAGPGPAAVAAMPARPPDPAPAAGAVDLAGTAGLCAELARVADPGDLPPLLARAAELIDASGVIVWVADRSGASLFPMLAHGYPAHVLARMGSISRDADNAAAASYREGDLRTVAAHGTLPGALVAPIITSEGCVGVLAAEMRHGAERHEPTQAVAAILAAQLATFVTTLPAATGETEQGM